MDCLADTNVLLRSIHQSHPMHASALAALMSLLASGDRVYVTPQNIIEFWNVCTRPADRNGLGLTPSEADREASRLEDILTLLPDIPGIYPEWRRLVVAHSVSGVRVHDARIVAAMNVYGISRLLTFNGPDFTRYARIRAIHPNDLTRPANP
ncbi:MAG TPA: type II toxin-antitoxin system VapC family toxin [Terriglobia bacterium]|nr:type II toxin-antitoxin system VapC family toxin [Terriglobia bacterium]